MKKTLVLFLLTILLISGFQLNAQQAHKELPATLLSEFQKHTETWRMAYNSGDAQNLAPLYSEDARYISGHVNGLEAIGRDNIVANFQGGISGGGHIESIEILQAEASGEMATLLTRYVAVNSGVTVSGRNLLVLKKVNNNWLILIHMTAV